MEWRSVIKKLLHQVDVTVVKVTGGVDFKKFKSRKETKLQKFMKELQNGQEHG